MPRGMKRTLDASRASTLMSAVGPRWVSVAIEVFGLQCPCEGRVCGRQLQCKSLRGPAGYAQPSAYDLTIGVPEIHHTQHVAMPWM